jgi:hypothetical protein
MKIDNILENNGWKRTKPFKGYSTITSDVVSIWRKGGVESEVVTGLNCVGYPPTLISPIPTDIKEKVYLEGVIQDQLVIEWIQITPEEEIIKFLNEIK